MSQSRFALSGVALMAMAAGSLAQGPQYDPESEAMKQTVTMRVPMVVDTTAAMQYREQFLRPPTGILTVPIGLPKELLHYFPVGNGFAYNRTQNDIMSQLGSPAGAFPGPGEQGLTPGDPDVAVGPDYVVGVVNGRITIHNKVTGAITFNVNPTTFFNGFGIPFSLVYDPRCWYDQSSGRFWIMYGGLHNTLNISYFLVAMSDDSDPRGTWTKWALNSTLNGTVDSLAWSDYPGFGGNSDVLMFTGNMFGFSSGGGYGKIRVAPKAQFLALSPTITYTDIWSFSNPSGGTAWSLQPARHIGSSVMPLLANVSGTNRCNIFGIQNPLTTPVLKKIGVSVSAFGGSGAANQKGTTVTLDTLDGRIYDVACRDNRVLVSHNIGGGGGSVVRWYDINASSFPTTASLTQSGNLTDATSDIYYCAPQINQYGTIGAGITKSSATEFVSLYYTGHETTDGAGTMKALTLKKAATLGYTGNGNGGTQRWGDYQGGDIDPVDNYTFWAIAMVPTSASAWTTEIYSYTIGALPASLTGTITLDGWSASPSGQSATLEFRTPSTTTVVYSYPITLDGSGQFTLPTVATGTYDIAVKFSHWLRNLVPSKTISAGANSIILSLTNGDAFVDNGVNLPDLNEIFTNFATVLASADMDGSGLVDLPDLNMVFTNFALNGVP